jgi:hypothetical protein
MILCYWKIREKKGKKSKQLKIFYFIMLINSIHVSLLVNTLTTVVMSPTHDTMVDDVVSFVY